MGHSICSPINNSQLYGRIYTSMNMTLSIKISVIISIYLNVLDFLKRIKDLYDLGPQILNGCQILFFFFSYPFLFFVQDGISSILKQILSWLSCLQAFSLSFTLHAIARLIFLKHHQIKVKVLTLYLISSSLILSLGSFFFHTAYFSYLFFF